MCYLSKNQSVCGCLCMCVSYLKTQQPLLYVRTLLVLIHSHTNYQLQRENILSDSFIHFALYSFQIFSNSVFLKFTIQHIFVFNYYYCWKYQIADWSLKSSLLLCVAFHVIDIENIPFSIANSCNTVINIGNTVIPC